MKLEDPLAGYYMVTGSPMIHLGFFFGIILLPKEDKCTVENVNYDKAILNL